MIATLHFGWHLIRDEIPHHTLPHTLPELIIGGLVGAGALATVSSVRNRLRRSADR
ncbi:hypothetical protein [Microvirga sp. Mcv34]|uniref:hypothetical protein n=1 Tax=Microvirga sp. Mcv34 TaxID=2926016 RepID=UPI0021C8C809|nr:hypothetical protein [Microvirga sp. Mcv34]